MVCVVSGDRDCCDVAVAELDCVIGVVCVVVGDDDDVCCRCC